MKKFLLSVAFALLAWTVSAQNWMVGGRIGSGLQADAAYVLGNDNYIEGRFGMYWANAGGHLTADFTALYNWSICKMNWTPAAGTWFFDAGAGINVGGKSHYAYVGVAGCAKLGLEIKGAPIRLSFDWTPAFGPGIAYGGGESVSEFNDHGLCNFGITCVYCF